MAKILFLDIGGVLLSNGWGHESRKEAARHFGLDYEEMDSHHSFIFNVYEIGRITLDEYLDTVVFHQRRDFSREAFKSFMFSQSAELPDMLSWLKDWKITQPDLRIISINNEGRELNDYRIQKFGLHDCFDAFISSCEVGMRKPDPGIFKLALGIAQADPKECLYFDDRAMLVETARKQGLNAHQHRNFDSTKELIQTLL